MPRIEVRPLKTLEEFRACERIQKIVWGNMGVGSEVMSVTQKFGGAVIGAFVARRIVGFIYAFLAQRDGQLIHWSHMMAVEPSFRDLGLGYRMKLAHRRIALSQGIRSICWTYDPLQSRNATLNVSRLCARVEDYIPDCYGRFPSRIEKGLASDRFVVDWQIATPRVRRWLLERPPAIVASTLSQVNETRWNAQGFLENRRIFLNLRDPRLLVEIPANTDEMRLHALGLARRWRSETRKMFKRYLSVHYRVAGFIPLGRATGGKCFYVLRRTERR